jgi:hypothetical protein
MLGLYASLAYRQWFKYLMWTSAVNSHDKKRILLCDGTLHLCTKHYDAIVEHTSTLISNSDTSVYPNFLQIFLLDLTVIIICVLISRANNSKQQCFFFYLVSISLWFCMGVKPGL